MESPDIHVLQTVKNWQFFGSFTFKQSRLPERVRLCMWFALCRNLCKWHRVYFPDLLWALRQEPGELTGRLHFHALIGGIPSYACDERTCMQIKTQWERIGGGIARVRMFDRQLNGPGYILKCVTSHEGFEDLVGANAYESAKFGSAQCHLMVANSVQRVGLAEIHRESRRLAHKPGMVEPHGSLGPANR